jgi:uncharacterized protein (DUF362 family)
MRSASIFDQLRVKNVLLLAVLGALGALVLVWEGYVERIQLPFALLTIALVCYDVWVAGFEISFKRLFLLSVIAGMAGYITQMVGVSHGFWRYTGPQQSYFFVPFTFMFAAISLYGLTTTWLERLFRALHDYKPRWPNLLLVTGLFARLLATIPRPLGELGMSFWLYYGALFLFGLAAGLRMNVKTAISLTVASWLIGGLSETLGAHSGLWLFEQDRRSPPAFLILGSWPLEFLLHYSLSGMLAGESLVARRWKYQEPRQYDLQVQHPMAVGGRALTVAAIRADDKINALDRVLSDTGFFEVVEKRRAETGKTLADFSIIIKPNFMFMYAKSDHTTYTDPQLVEHLIRQLQARGYTSICIAEAQSAYGNFLNHREVDTVARHIGYTGQGYRIVDLTLEMVPHTFPGKLGQHWVGRTWKEADFRISFAKNKTHTWAWYTLTMKNVYGALPLQDKLKEYHTEREIYYPTIDFLVEFPVHYGLIDAYWSADGPFGIFADKEPNLTQTVIGGENLLAVDWVGASKMGLDPQVSRYMQLAVQAFGRPEIQIIGDASRYRPWENVHKELTDVVDTVEETYGFFNVLFAISSSPFVDKIFTLKPQTRLMKLLRPLGAIIGLFSPFKRSNLTSKSSS